MQFPDFKGSEILVDKLDGATNLDCPKAITGAVRTALCELIADESVHLPECVYEPAADHYARRLLYHSPDLGYSVVAMTWGPQQGTHVHDHCGMWCVEGVWRGEVTVTQYHLLQHQGERYRFEPVGSMQVGVGSAGSLIPPHEYHVIANPKSSDIAVTVHVYSGEMSRCNVFEPLGEDWYVRRDRRLGYD